MSDPPSPNYVHYYEINSAFEQLYLEDSYLLNVVESDKSIIFKVEFVLRECSPYFSTPRPGEQYCYKVGKLAFLNCELIQWHYREFIALLDPVKEPDYGNIDTFIFSLETLLWAACKEKVIVPKNGYFLEGEWGAVSILSDPPVLCWG